MAPGYITAPLCTGIHQPRARSSKSGNAPHALLRYTAAVIEPEICESSATSPRGPRPEGPTSATHRLKQWLAGLSDARLTLLVAPLLFVLAAWPLLLVELPPFQDLPHHVATSHIIAHPDLYPQYLFNGFLKSNSLLTLWLYVTGSHGLFGAARGLTAIVLAMNALALPAFVLHFAGRRSLLVAMLFVWPLVHGFFVSMGMLNFVFAFALSLILLTVIDQQRQRPTLMRGLVIAGMSGVLWYAHPFPLAVVVVLVALHVASRSTWQARIRASLELLLPLAATGLLSLVTAQQHLVKVKRSSAVASAAYSYLDPLEIVSHLWRDVSGALTLWGSMTIVPALLLPYFVWKQRRKQAARPFLSMPAMAVLAAAYVSLPFMMSNWSYLHCRLVPFLWAGLALRLPPTLPRPIAVVLVACALSFSTVMGIDYVRLDHDRAAFTAGMDAVPARATLLPLMFKKSKTSYFTASLTHAWGYYTVEKNTSAPLVYAMERSYPIIYRDFPPGALIQPALDQFAETYATPALVCKILGQFPIDSACATVWRELWNAFWQQAEPRFSHLLTWAIPPAARPMIPERYHRIFEAGELEIYVRTDATTAGH